MSTSHTRRDLFPDSINTNNRNTDANARAIGEIYNRVENLQTANPEDIQSAISISYEILDTIRDTALRESLINSIASMEEMVR